MFVFFLASLKFNFPMVYLKLMANDLKGVEVIDDWLKNSPSRSVINSLFFWNGYIILRPIDPLLFLKDFFIPKLIIENEVLVP